MDLLSIVVYGIHVEQHDGLYQWLGRNFDSNRVGPEALANHATVEDCIGFPPTFMYQVKWIRIFLEILNFTRSF